MHETNALKASLADRYELLRLLGAGGMASVYLARDLKHDRDVAIKVLSPNSAMHSVLKGSLPRSKSRPICAIPTCCRYSTRAAPTDSCST